MTLPGGFGRGRGLCGLGKKIQIGRRQAPPGGQSGCRTVMRGNGTHALLCRIQKVLEELPSPGPTSPSPAARPFLPVAFVLPDLQRGAGLRPEQGRQGPPGLQPAIASSGPQPPVGLPLGAHQVPQAAGRGGLGLPLALALAPVRLEEARFDVGHGSLVPLHRLGPEVQEGPTAELQRQGAGVLKAGRGNGREGRQGAGGRRRGGRGGGDGVTPLGGLRGTGQDRRLGQIHKKRETRPRPPSATSVSVDSSLCVLSRVVQQSDRQWDMSRSFSLTGGSRIWTSASPAQSSSHQASRSLRTDRVSPCSSYREHPPGVITSVSHSR